MVLLALLACPSSMDDTGTPDTGTPDTGPLLQLEGVVRGESCPSHQSIGHFGLWDNGNAGGRFYTAPNPYVGQPTIESEDCIYYEYDAAGCGICPEDLVCRGDGECVAWPDLFEDLVVEGSSGEESFVLEHDLESGHTTGSYGDPSLTWDLVLRFGGLEVEIPGMAVASDLQDVQVVVEVDDTTGTYGALDATWTPLDDGAVVRSEIPINHHAHPGTLTACSASTEAGGFHATAEQIEPLSVVTGLEFQGLEHMHVAAVYTSLGCAEVLGGETIRESAQQE